MTIGLHTRLAIDNSKNAADREKSVSIGDLATAHFGCGVLIAGGDFVASGPVSFVDIELSATTATVPPVYGKANKMRLYVVDWQNGPWVGEPVPNAANFVAGTYTLIGMAA